MAFEGQCYYLDGTSGICLAGYAPAPFSVIESVGEDFAGKTYKTQVSGNCCILGSDPGSAWALYSLCNSPGIFPSGPVDPGCQNWGISDQLTICGSI